MKPTFLVLTALCVSCLAIAQEPINTAVRQPSATQPTITQPTALQPADPTVPSLYEPFAFQPMINIPHQAPQQTVAQRDAPPVPQPRVAPVQQITAADVQPHCSCPSTK